MADSRIEVDSGQRSRGCRPARSRHLLARSVGALVAAAGVVAAVAVVAPMQVGGVSAAVATAPDLAGQGSAEFEDPESSPGGDDSRSGARVAGGDNGPDNKAAAGVSRPQLAGFMLIGLGLALACLRATALSALRRRLGQETASEP